MVSADYAAVSKKIKVTKTEMTELKLQRKNRMNHKKKLFNVLFIHLHVVLLCSSLVPLIYFLVVSF